MICLPTIRLAFTIPPKVSSDHLVEPSVVGLEEGPQPSQVTVTESRMRPPLCFTETVRTSAALALLETRKTLGPIEVEVVVGHQAPQAQKVLHQRHLLSGIANQFLAAHHMYLSWCKVFEPSGQMALVESDSDGRPAGVDAVFVEGQIFKRQCGVWTLGGRLGVVGQGPGHGVSDHDQKTHPRRQGVDSGGRLSGDKVTRSLLHGYLVREAQRHLLSGI